MDHIVSQDQINQTLTQLSQLRIQHYQAKVLFSWQWWLLVDKRRLSKILLYGLIAMLLNSLVDEHLVNLGMYAYPHRMDPIWGGTLTGTVTWPPIIGMLAYQYFPGWKGFSAAVLVGSALLALVGLPLLKLMDIVQFLKWSIIYSFIILVVLKLFTKWITDRIVNKEEGYKT